jgi:3-methyladenine DNA glycosylase AlkC
LTGLDELELKQRVAHIIKALSAVLPSSFEQAALCLEQVPEHWSNKDEAVSVFAAWPVIDYVAEYGLNQPDISLALLARLTSLFSAEFAVRPFIQRDPEQTMAVLLQWTKSPSDHIRRLASEGCRPKLPWGMQLRLFVEDPTPLLPILEALKDDSSDYVRRSVANNLNDISKDHPQWVLELCSRWMTDASVERRWIIKHATRSLVKQGYAEVFPLLGYPLNPPVVITRFELKPDTLTLGEDLYIELDLALEDGCGEREVPVILDYVVYHVKANKRLSPKVFKLKALTLTQGQHVTLRKKHPFKAITTRKYYSGEHQLAIHINGVERARKIFYLSV